VPEPVAQLGEVVNFEKAPQSVVQIEWYDL
jgi:hypothetical protein